MINKRKGFVSAKLRKTYKNPFNQKEPEENNNNNKFNKRSKYYNLSLNINNDNLNNERIFGLVSPKSKFKHYETSSKFLRSFSSNNSSSNRRKKKFGSFSSKNIFSTNYGGSSQSSGFPTVVSHRTLVKSPSAVNHRVNKNFFTIEDEKLSQEIYYLKQDINKMNKKLLILGEENKEKDNILTERENEINSIINKNNNNYNSEEALTNENNDINENNNYGYNTISDDISVDKNNDNYFSNNFNLSLIFKDISLNNYNYNNLFIRIRHQILKTFKEIEEKEEEIKNNKKSIYYTKMKEINIESAFYKEQINKMNVLINNALSVHEKNQSQLNEYELLQNKIKQQEKVIKSLNKAYKDLKDEESSIHQNIKKMKNLLIIKKSKKYTNYNLINDLIKKNDDLSKDKIILTQYDDKAMSKKIIKLKKDVELYKFHLKSTNNDLDHLEEQKKNLMKKKRITTIPDKNGKFIINNKSYKYDPEKINANKELEKQLFEKYKAQANNVKVLENKMIECQKKLNEILNNININGDINPNNIDDINNLNDINNIDSNFNKNSGLEENEEDTDNIINFGINDDNPFYSNEENNIPEKTNKFNNSQFGNFAYILFKNFESKNILLNESQVKIINPLLNIISQNNIKEIKYNDDSFNFVINELTKIIMNVLENTNQKNEKLISIFIGALLHNSNYDINKLINYINVLFSYTNNYSTDEELFSYKLQTKYKDKITLLYNKLYEYIKDNLTSTDLHNYIPLLKMKEIIEVNNIQLKDKYLEFLYYYMKKFNDPNSNLDDLDFDMFNNLFVLDNKNNNENYNNENNENKTDSNGNDSVTEITNEEYEKQLKGAIDIIKKGINDSGVSFSDFVKNITFKAEVDGTFYDYFTIESFNEELKKSNIILSELKLSCLCNKYCLPENLKFIDKNKIEKDINES